MTIFMMHDYDDALVGHRTIIGIPYEDAKEAGCINLGLPSDHWRVTMVIETCGMKLSATEVTLDRDVEKAVIWLYADRWVGQW